MARRPFGFACAPSQPTRVPSPIEIGGNVIGSTSRKRTKVTSHAGSSSKSGAAILRLKKIVPPGLRRYWRSTMPGPNAGRELWRVSLGLPDAYVNVLAIAARLHDEGKRHWRWQRAFNAPNDGNTYAKTKGPINVRLLERYRHEFGSLPWAERDDKFKALPPDLQELALHLVAAHHGWARPVISTTGSDDPPSVLEERARDVTLRFARLQKQWGPWGLAWFEALLRAADQQASRDNDARESA